MKKGFTLIELLAVIVILAIVSLIAVPIVLNIISDTKGESINRSIELYISHAQKMVVKEEMKDLTFHPNKCEIIQNGDLKCDDKIIKVDMKGKKPDGGIIITGEKKSYINLKYDDKFYHEISGESLNETLYSVNPICKSKTGKISLTLGTEYECEVKENTKFNFFVLSDDENNVNLIMDSNICLNGTNIYTNENNHCRYAWYDAEMNNSYGPITAMTTLYEATKEWNKVQNIIFEYKDEENKYGGIKVTENKMEIIPKTGTSYIKYFDLGKPLRSRLPKYSEVLNTGCKVSHISSGDYSGYGSCPVWMMKNIRYKDITDYLGYDKYEQNKESLLNNVEKISGYWQLSSSYGGSTAYTSNPQGHISGENSIIANEHFGIRPVITIPKYNLIN